MKKAMIWIWTLMIALVLSGCVPLSVDLQQADQPVSLPLPEEAPIEPAVGDTLSAVSYYVPLYSVSHDRQLISFKRAITVEPGQSLAEQTLLALLQTDDAADSPFPEGTRLLSLERSGGAAVVDLSIEARNVESDRQLMQLREVIAATLIGLDGIDCVNVLIAGREEGLLSLPAGAISSVHDDLSAKWTRFSAEAELHGRSDSEEVFLERSVILYYPTQDGSAIAPVAASVRLSGDDPITPILQALTDAPTADGLRSPLPSGASALSRSPELVETGDGRRMARLCFDSSLVAMLEREGLSEWQLYAALTYTLTGFVPELDGLIVMLGDGQLTRVDRNGTELAFTGGVMTRSDYPDALCRMTAVYVGAQQGGLLQVSRPMDPFSALSPRALLQELFREPAACEEGAVRIMPDGVSIDDVLGIRLSGGEAVVNLSSNFYRCCQSLTDMQEQALIYAMVNTLTGLDTVSSVRFQVEGETVDCLVSTVYLRGSLMRNPGIIQETEQNKDSL